MSSSRVLRLNQAMEAAPIAWRRTGSAAPPQDRRSSAGPGQSSSPDVSAEMERQMQARIAAAREQGRAEAEAAAQQRAMNAVNPAISGLKAMIGDLSAQGRRLRTEAERDTVKLAVVIARRILHRELSVDPEAVLGLVKAAFTKVEARETHRLRVNPTDAALLREHRGKLDLPPAVEIVGDGTLPQGSAVFETSRGDLDASIDTQLGEIERGLADVVRGRLK